VRDSELGLMLYRNRYYSTGLGRFINRDPIGYNAGDVNLYRYVGNMPGIWVDPLGLQQIFQIGRDKPQKPKKPSKIEAFFDIDFNVTPKWDKSPGISFDISPAGKNNIKFSGQATTGLPPIPIPAWSPWNPGSTIPGTGGSLRFRCEIRF